MDEHDRKLDALLEFCGNLEGDIKDLRRRFRWLEREFQVVHEDAPAR
jgi:hypothetical protein